MDIFQQIDDYVVWAIIALLIFLYNVVSAVFGQHWVGYRFWANIARSSRSQIGFKMKISFLENFAIPPGKQPDIPQEKSWANIEQKDKIVRNNKKRKDSLETRPYWWYLLTWRTS